MLCIDTEHEFSSVEIDFEIDFEAVLEGLFTNFLLATDGAKRLSTN